MICGKRPWHEIDRVTWMPAWGRDRIRGMMEMPSGLVPIPPAVLGSAYPGVLLSGMQPLDDHPGNPAHRLEP